MSEASETSILSEEECANESVQKKFFCHHCPVTYRLKKRLEEHFKKAACKICKVRFECRETLRKHLAFDSIVCKKCNKKLHSQKLLNKHLSATSCAHCEKTFECGTRLRQHLVKSKKCRDQNSRKCVGCSLILDGNEELAKHFAKNRCKGCGEKFFCATKLKKHQEIKKCGLPKVKSPAMTSLSCPSCARKFETSFNLKVHKSKSGCGLSENRNRGSHFKCKFCNFPLSNVDKLRRHQKNPKCPRCKVFVGCWRAVSAHLPTCARQEVSDPGVPPRPNPPCHICGENYRSLSFHQDANHKCKKCARKFSCYGLLRRHKKVCKQDRMCPHCKTVLQATRNLPGHVKPRPCLKCKWMAPCFSLWRVHVCVREGQEKGVQPQECPYCRLSARMDEHLTPERCHRCGFVQPCRTMLQHHLARCAFWGVRECLICTDKFKSAIQLAKHVEKVHVLDFKTASFDCDFCGEHFKRKKYFIEHVKMHLDNSPEVCNQIREEDAVQNLEIEAAAAGASYYRADSAASSSSVEFYYVKDEVESENQEDEVEVLKDICAAVYLKDE